MKTSLMTYQEYAKIEHATPYVFTIKRPGHGLWYFGADHAYDPANPQFTALRNLWNQFINEIGKASNQTVLLVEGGIPRNATSEETAILEDGEAGFAAFLAVAHSVAIESPEPPLSHEYQKLLSQFSKDEIHYYYFARVVTQWNSMSSRPDFSSYVTKYLEQDAREGHWSSTEYSLSTMYKIHKELFNKEFDLEDKDFFQHIVNPLEPVAVTNRIAQASGNIRDAFIVGEIQKHWNQGKNIFIVYGDSHAVRQEQFLKESLN